jgi:hypothetical protein
MLILDFEGDGKVQQNIEPIKKLLATNRVLFPWLLHAPYPESFFPMQVLKFRCLTDKWVARDLLFMK